MSARSSEIVLAIDTSGPRLQLALAGGELAACHVEDIAKGHAEILFDRIGQLLAEQGVTYGQLTRLAVTTGPGSFTGLRIGISAARGLALALDLPVIGMPNLLALSLGAEPGQPVDVVIDARRDEFYAQSFAGPGAPQTPPALLTGEAARTRYPHEGASMISDPQVDILRLAAFAVGADPAAFPPDPTYIRAADAKPQSGKQVERA